MYIWRLFISSPKTNKYGGSESSMSIRVSEYFSIVNFLDILPRINPWDSLDYNNITTPYRSGYSMIFQDLATIGVPHLGWYFLAAGQMPVPISLS